METNVFTYILQYHANMECIVKGLIVFICILGKCKIIMIIIIMPVINPSIMINNIKSHINNQKNNQ